MAPSRAWNAIFRFELRYQLRQPLFPLVTIALGVLLFIAGADGSATSGRLHVNAPAVILEQLFKWIYLALFLLTALVSSAAVRDFERGTAELFFSKPISGFDYLSARFAGTMVVCTLPYLIGALALAVGTWMSASDPTRVGPFRLAPYAFALGVFIIPTLLSLGAVFFAFASWTRSSLATYIGVVAFLAASAATGMATSRPETAWISQLLDPFGITALANTLKDWTVAELNAGVPGVGGILLWNRLLWLTVGFAALGARVVTSDPSRFRTRLGRSQPPTDISTAPAEAVPREHQPTIRRLFTRRVVLVQFARQVRRETTAVVWNLPFLGILTLAIVVLMQDASTSGNLFGMPVYPRTYLMLESLQGIYSVLLLVVVVLYSSELMWKERSLEVDGILDSMPTPSSVYFAAKLTALALAIVLFLAAGVVALVVFQLSHGYNDLHLAQYARGVVLVAVYPLLMMVLACFCHVLARNRLMGYGFVILFIITWDLLEELGFEHHLYRFGSLPPIPWSDFNGYGPFFAAFGWYTLYWALAALVLGGLSVLFWRRGTDDAWKARLRSARARRRGAVRVVLAVGGISAVVTGTWIFYNTNVLNAYVPSTREADARATYERLYGKYQGLTLPRIVAVRADVDIFPERRSVSIHGSYRLRNQSSAAMRDIHVSIPKGVRVNRVDLPAHDVILEDDQHGYRILRLTRPLAPGDVISFGFDLSVDNRGFVNNGTETTILDNGTYFTRRDFFPVIGFDDQRRLTDADERRRHKLPALRFADVHDLAARQNSPRASDADRVDFESTVSTSIDQIAVTSGELEREWTDGARRYFHYRANVPITHHFAYASARYAITRRRWTPSAGSAQPVTIEVFHHPGHDANVGRMIDAAEKSLDYFTTNFGPYQHRSLRIVEFPRYVRDGTSFPGLIALSESTGFNARLDDDVAIDYPFYITAHEVAHQWWGQQLVAANVKGAGMLHETLAQYSALMVMAKEFGDEKLRPVLANEHDQYLRGRRGERGTEPALALTEREEYVYYHKGALAMYALRDAVGEERLNRVLSGFHSRVALRGPPYPTTADLLVDLRPLVSGDSHHLIEDLFERTTTFRNTIVAATYTERADGAFLVRVEVEAHKLHTDSAGSEREVPMDDAVDIAISGARGTAAGDGSRLVFETRRISSSPVTLELVVRQRPASVVIDPYYKLIDRDRRDNVRALSLITGLGAESSGASPAAP